MEKGIRIRLKTFAPVALMSLAFLLQPFEKIRANNNVPVNDHVLQSSFMRSDADEPITDTTDVKSRRASTKAGCTKNSCNVYAEVDKSEQMMYVYVSGELQHSFPVSTGRRGYTTPNLDLRPSGPVYEKYRSKKYPEGDYQGMGNMPYAVFLRGGYAIHGTTPGSIPKLGKPASHGCIRLHPDDAKVFYDLVRSIGLENTWVTVRP